MCLPVRSHGRRIKNQESRVNSLVTSWTGRAQALAAWEPRAHKEVRLIALVLWLCSHPFACLATPPCASGLFQILLTLEGVFKHGFYYIEGFITRYTACLSTGCNFPHVRRHPPDNQSLAQGGQLPETDSPGSEQHRLACQGHRRLVGVSQG